MTYTYVGLIPTNLSSGRPLVFGDTLEDADLTPADDVLEALLVPVAAPSAPAPAPAAPAPAPAPTPTPSTPDPEAR